MAAELHQEIATIAADSGSISDSLPVLPLIDSPGLIVNLR
jgi:hypothetical protein